MVVRVVNDLKDKWTHYSNYFIQQRECQDVVLTLISSSTNVEITFSSFKELVYEHLLVENGAVCFLLLRSFRNTEEQKFISFLLRGEKMSRILRTASFSLWMAMSVSVVF